MARWLPIPPLQPYPRGAFGPDLVAAFTVLFLGVPQGLAYATIAGLPPVVGLYAATIPAMVASLFRSSSYVISGPTNALSLLVGAAVAHGMGADPTVVALTLALLVGVFQAGAGLLRLGALVDFISTAVVLGYITGAGVLIGFGQLHNATGTTGAGGKLWVTIGSWLETLGDAKPLAVVVTLGTIAVVVAIRVFNRKTGRRVPPAIVAMSLALGMNLLLGLETRGLQVISELAPIPAGLPPFTLPDLSYAPGLIPLAAACAVLSLVESSSVARSISSRRGEPLEASTEFVGQGLGNIAAGFFGGYPVSGSLTRSALNERAGARTRMAGVLGGLMMLAALVTMGQVLNHTPVASLAGLMFVVAYDLVDVPRISAIVRASREDAIAFTVTMLGTWVLSLDVAIYVGVGLSLVLFLRRSRQVRVTELIPAGARLKEATSLSEIDHGPVRLLHVEGALFFGAAGELRDALSRVLSEPTTQALVVRLKRATDLDATTATMLGELASLAREQGRHMLLAGVTPAAFTVLERSGALAQLGESRVFQTRAQWFSALASALALANALTPEHGGSFTGFLANTQDGTDDPSSPSSPEEQAL